MIEQSFVLTKVEKGQRVWVGKDLNGAWCLVDNYDRAWEFVSSPRAQAIRAQLSDFALNITPVE
jgi:hypothetical protein